MLEKLRRSVKASPIVTMGEYRYFVAPITDGIPCMDPDVLREIAAHIAEVADLDCDIIAAPEAMGIPVAVALSLRTGIPYNVIRKRSYDLPGEVSVCQVTGYSKCDMFINGLEAGDRVVLVDDIISTGGTLFAVIQALQMMGVELVDAVAVLERGPGKARIEDELGVRVRTLLRADIVGDRVVVSQ
jgi:adenine phosphoribosyltransferase